MWIASPKQMAVAFAVGYNVVNIAVDERVIVFRKLLFRFVECQPFEHADVPLAKCRRLVDFNIDQLRKRVTLQNGR